MNQHNDDLKRSQELGMTLDQFQSLVGHDPLDRHARFLSGGYVGPTDKTRDEDEDKDGKKLKKKKQADASPYSLHDEMTDVEGIGDGTMVPFQTDEDVKNKNARELENYWDKPLETPAEHAMYYGFHVHSKDNVYGLHRHYPGAPLGGGHMHGPQNKLGYHTHRYSQEELLQFKFARPGVMIQLDGPHVHQHNAPDGKHSHCEENFGPAMDHSDEQMDKADKNIVSMHPKRESDTIYDDD